MRMLLRLIGLLVLLAVLLAGLAFALPDRAHVERSITIARPQAQVWLLLSNLRRFNEWSPWFARDPAARYTYSGPEAAVGSRLAWASERSDVGSGSQTIVALKPFESVELELDFGNLGKSQVRYELRTESNETRVTWRMDSELPLHLDQRFGWNLLGRYMGLFMDRLTGPDFERGLLNLRALADTFPNVDIAGVTPQQLEMPARKLIYVEVDSAGDDAALKRAWDAGLLQLHRFVVQHGLKAGSAPLALTRRRDAGSWSFELALPAEYDLMPEDTAVRGRVLPAGSVVQISHSGSLRERQREIDKLQAWVAVKGLRAGTPLIEEYADDAALLQGQVRIALPLQPVAQN